jgi:hypothetical protein
LGLVAALQRMVINNGFGEFRGRSPTALLFKKEGDGVINNFLMI